MAVPSSPRPPPRHRCRRCRRRLCLVVMIARSSPRSWRLTASTVRESPEGAFLREAKRGHADVGQGKRAKATLFFPHGRTGGWTCMDERTDGRTNARVRAARGRPAGSTIREALATSQHAPERGSISRLGATRRSTPRRAFGSARQRSRPTQPMWLTNAFYSDRFRIFRAVCR